MDWACYCWYGLIAALIGVVCVAIGFVDWLEHIGVKFVSVVLSFFFFLGFTSIFI